MEDSCQLLRRSGLPAHPTGSAEPKKIISHLRRTTLTTHLKCRGACPPANFALKALKGSFGFRLAAGIDLIPATTGLATTKMLRHLSATGVIPPARPFPASRLQELEGALLACGARNLSSEDFEKNMTLCWV